MDAIHIEGLELFAHIGVPEEERVHGQRLTVNLTLYPERALADLGDDVANTVDYFAVSKTVQALAQERRRKLIETLAEDISALLLSTLPLAAVEIELRKYILPDTAFVAIRLRRNA